jgi:hypothetical protein
MMTSLEAMPTYRKTDKGQTEIETRAFRLAPRLRTPLIMVDGRRTDEDLRKLIATQPDETLQTLLDQGFIEIVDAAPSVPSKASANSALAIPPASSQPVDEPTPPDAAAPPMRFEELRRLAVRSLIDQVGPAAEGVALKMEKARNAQELRPLLGTARDILSSSTSQQAAAEFAARFIAPLRP